MLGKRRELLDIALRVSKRTGKSVLRQALEFIQLKRRNPTLGASDYYWFRLYDPEYMGASRPEDYIGWRAEEQLAWALNPRGAVTPAWDKLTFTLIAHSFDLPVPELIALYRPGADRLVHVAADFLNTPDALATWLRANTRWPVFAKPSYGARSAGVHCLAGYQPEGDALLTLRGEKLPLNRFVSDVVGAPSGFSYRREMGYLFQEVLQPHPEIVRLTNSRSISGVRIVVILDDAGVEVVASLWKIAADQNDSDLYTTEQPRFAGNMMADIEPRTGRVGKIFDLQGKFARLPGADPSVDCIILPNWDEVIALCTRAATIFPLMRIQHYDVALTERGPCILELNDWGAILGLQQFGRGLLTDRMRALLRSYGDRTEAPWIGRLCG
jgi:Sugar-transfer associated ATP-grasp